MKKKLLIILLVICILSDITGCTKTENPTASTENTISVHYIDVDQGDSILIQVNNKNMLIDAGPKDSRPKLIGYLNNLSIKKLDYVIATHPHEDHIGNMYDIISNFEIGSFYAPKVEASTKTFERMVLALKNKNLKINAIKADDNSIDLGENTTVSVFSPIDNKYDNLNNYSPIIKIKYKNTSFLFTGDAEKEVEGEILKADSNISADVIKLGHHGSTSSTSEAFLKKVNPSVAVISVGKDNSYGHPHSETLSLIKKYDIKLYRTDTDGSIIITSDGKNITKK